VGAGEAGPADEDAPDAAPALALGAAATLGEGPFATTDGPANPPAVWTMPIVRSAMPPKAARIAAAIFFRGVRRFRPSDGAIEAAGSAGNCMSVRRYPDKDACPSGHYPSTAPLTDWRTMIPSSDMLGPDRPTS
jgi:hypothetical protein